MIATASRALRIVKGRAVAGAANFVLGKPLPSSVDYTSFPVLLPEWCNETRYFEKPHLFPASALDLDVCAVHRLRTPRGHEELVHEFSSGKICRIGGAADHLDSGAFKEEQSLAFTTGESGMFPSIMPGLFSFFDVGSRGYNRGLKDIMYLHKEGVRRFSKATSVPAQMQKPMKLRLYMGSPGVIGEPYKKPDPPLPFLKRWFSKEGWKRRQQSWMAMIKTTYTIAKLRQKNKGYNQQKFYQEASDLYRQINAALANGERTTLRHLVTDKVFSVMKNELKHRESTWAKVHWELVGPISQIRTIQGRLIGVDKNNQDNAFVQLTLRILSKQKFAAYEKSGKLVAGDPEKELLVEDYWVFEKPLLLTDVKWRLCGRLSV